VKHVVGTFNNVKNCKMMSTPLITLENKLSRKRATWGSS